MPKMDSKIYFGFVKGCSSAMDQDEADSDCNEASICTTDSAGKSFGRVKSSSVQPKMYGTVKSASAVLDDTEMEGLDEEVQDKLSQLVRLQAADGHFVWNDVIDKCYGMAREELMANSPDFASEEVWITSLVVAILEQMLELKDLWELVVRKARKYLEKNVTLANVEKLVQAASTLLAK